MTDFGRRAGDMLKSVYDADKDGVIALAQTEADMTKAVYDSGDDGVVDDIPAHAAEHEDGGGDEIDTTDLAGHVAGGFYVDRGDPSGWDFVRPNLDTDGNAHDLDLSSIVPEGAIAVHLYFEISGSSTGLFFWFREKGNSNTYNRLMQATQAASVLIHDEGFVRLDANRKIEYKSSNDAFGAYNVLVRGWII